MDAGPGSTTTGPASDDLTVTAVLEACPEADLRQAGPAPPPQVDLGLMLARDLVPVRRRRSPRAGYAVRRRRAGRAGVGGSTDRRRQGARTADPSHRARVSRRSKQTKGTLRHVVHGLTGDTSCCNEVSIPASAEARCSEHLRLRDPAPEKVTRIGSARGGVVAQLLEALAVAEEHEADVVDRAGGRRPRRRRAGGRPCPGGRSCPPRRPVGCRRGQSWVGHRLLRPSQDRPVRDDRDPRSSRRPPPGAARQGSVHRDAGVCDLLGPPLEEVQHARRRDRPAG